ncbi:MAG: dihydrolipoamide acetyltransferase family protein [Bacteroidetes bacterium]|nr:dihydrolipoamide acetyltransferase family protein [Bacteroidota bacterium]MDA0936335.1 dihydrolipoamide acetyltransferase family protein [Bacteroidota bacterium]
MAKHLLKLPKMGESVVEATLTKWLKEVGDTVEVDDIIVEIATDKVDSDVPSEVSGVLVEKKFQENDVVQVGQVMAVIQTEGEAPEMDTETQGGEEMITQRGEMINPPPPPSIELSEPTPDFEKVSQTVTEAIEMVTPTSVGSGNAFYSPLVKSIAKAEGISEQELATIKGSGKDSRVTKKDILSHLKNRNGLTIAPPETTPKEILLDADLSAPDPEVEKPASTAGGGDQIIEMGRMAKLTADHMIKSKQTSAHVQSFIEADVTRLWDWREKVKNEFMLREGEKLTFTPLIITALIKALKEFPMLNSSVEGDRIRQKKAINIGMATAMADGNLIVPVIKNADHLNLVGLAKAVNDLAQRARSQQLKPEEVQEGTFTFTNIGNFGSLTGTPIINQPQVGIIAVGVIRKMPAVIETAQGDSIAIRKKMIISHSFDHRIINGAMGGQFIKSMADYLENWEINRPI